MEDVTIRVRQETQGNALAQTEAEIRRLYQAAAAYESRGMTDAARSARGDARSLERDIARDTRDRVAAERSITAERAQQASLERAQANQRAARLSQAGHAAAGAVGSVTGSSAGPASGLIDFAAKGGVAGIAAIVAGIAGAAIMGGVAKQNRALRIIGLENEGAETMQRRQAQRMASFEGTSGSAREDAASAESDVIRLQEERKKLEELAKVKLFSPSSWMRALTGQNQNELIKNSNETGVAMQRQADAKEAQRMHFATDGAKEIDIVERKARGEMASAKAAEMALNYHREVVRLQREGATHADAIRGADAKFAADIRQREQAMAGLISSRTGAAAAARIASLGSLQYGQARSEVAGQKIEEQTRLQREHHEEAMNARTRRKFSSPPLHE